MKHPQNTHTHTRNNNNNNNNNFMTEKEKNYIKYTNERSILGFNKQFDYTQIFFSKEELVKREEYLRSKKMRNELISNSINNSTNTSIINSTTDIINNTNTNTNEDNNTNTTNNTTNEEDNDKNVINNSEKISNIDNLGVNVSLNVINSRSRKYPRTAGIINNDESDIINNNNLNNFNLNNNISNLNNNIDNFNINSNIGISNSFYNYIISKNKKYEYFQKVYLKLLLDECIFNLENINNTNISNNLDNINTSTTNTTNLNTTNLDNNINLNIKLFNLNIDQLISSLSTLPSLINSLFTSKLISIILSNITNIIINTNNNNNITTKDTITSEEEHITNNKTLLSLSSLSSYSNLILFFYKYCKFITNTTITDFLENNFYVFFKVKVDDVVSCGFGDVYFESGFGLSLAILLLIDNFNLTNNLTNNLNNNISNLTLDSNISNNLYLNINNIILDNNINNKNLKNENLFKIFLNSSNFTNSDSNNSTTNSSTTNNNNSTTTLSKIFHDKPKNIRKTGWTFLALLSKQLPTYRDRLELVVSMKDVIELYLEDVEDYDIFLKVNGVKVEDIL